jgi:hypothetical protein
VWKNRLKVVPLCGKVGSKLFHCVEKTGRQHVNFSTVWKFFFHSVENLPPQGGGEVRKQPPNQARKQEITGKQERGMERK